METLLRMPDAVSGLGVRHVGTLRQCNPGQVYLKFCCPGRGELLGWSAVFPAGKGLGLFGSRRGFVFEYPPVTMYSTRSMKHDHAGFSACETAVVLKGR
ncbi:hypothetical protein DSM19430T_21250 [Desulfovibrio psychrotolerans]|uniref:Uncharacterized protein n=1 Tax=Desulfovibrio psychrotolerans TaxID=415242 RepID=A0A7J0BWA3_9BACT|nr:hypothetical protein DSM19430T_21250 [Desulfovibrio psychrotolerans]